MSDRDDLAELVQQSCAQTGMDWVYDHEALGVSEAILAAGYSKPKILCYVVVDRGGAMVGNTHTDRESAQVFADEWTADCKSAEIDWDYRVAEIVEPTA